MASFFGEVIEPSSRAIFDDFSDEEETINEVEFQLSWNNADKKLPSVFDVIFIIHGKLSLAFAETYLLDRNSKKPAAEVNVVFSRTKDKQFVDEINVKTLPSRIYLDQNKAICLVSPSNSGESGYQFTETLSSMLKISKKVIIITNDSMYNYKTPFINELPAAFVKELRTSYNSSNEVVEKLPTPNFITGIPAAILSWCQINKIDGSMLICYSDQQKLDSITASPYLSALRNLNHNIIKNEKPDFNKKTFYGCPEIIGGSSNIYI